MAKVLGIGNALVDILTRIDKDEILEDFGLPKGSMTLVDLDTSNYIHAETTGSLSLGHSGSFSKAAPALEDMAGPGGNDRLPCAGFFPW